MSKIKTVKDFVEWVEIMHLQNTNGRETHGDMFRLGVEAAIEELSEFKSEEFVTAEDMIKSLGLLKRKTLGIMFRLESFWLGLHYSRYNKRYCLNLLPCVTIWWTVRGGQPPRKTL